MQHYKLLITLPVVLGLAACANSGANYQPVVDGPVGPNYNADLAQCQQLAASQGALDSNAGGKAAAGAGVAAATTAVFNNEGNNVRDAAAVGALAGLTASAIDQNSKKEAIVRNCMSKRGYNVVG
ncbi:glycine zipper family protein [Shimia sp.]|uniref:glycine zipper family protein n=1 Tax=Shimia sp. TaxID=1954381 RepID=UPI003297D177